MASRKKKTLSQQVVGVAAVGLPTPAKKVLGNRFIATLVVIIVPVLFVTGMLTVKWENGRPRLSIDRERAVELEEKVANKLQDRHQQDDSSLREHLPLVGGLGNGHVESPADWQQHEGLGERMTRRFEEVKADIAEDSQQIWHPGSASTEQQEQRSPVFQPFSRFQESSDGVRR